MGPVGPATAAVLVSADSLGAARSPTTAFVIALVPGALLHGAGHAYAGDLQTARWLALSEAAGYAAMFTSHARGASPGGRTEGGAIVYSIGASLFFGSWLYDILAAPSAARARPGSAAAGAPSWEVATAPGAHGATLRVTHRF